MRALSLRGWLLLVSVLFAVLVVGGIALTTYVIVSDGMQVVAVDTTGRIAAAAGSVVRDAITAAQSEAVPDSADPDTPGPRFEQVLRTQLPQRIAGADLGDAEFALYDEKDATIWRSASGAIADDGLVAARAQARRTGAPTTSIFGVGNLFEGLFSEAQLGVTIAHVPVALTAGRVGVLDVSYQPTNEESVIDRIRIPMAVLALSAMLIMVVLMQTSMSWVLNLVNELRRGADSIDAGRLHERLPADADNEIGDLARSINRLIERLERRAEAQSRFVADASHELATPVAGIRGYTAILREWGAEDPNVREEAIDAIDRESRRMARLTSDLLNLLHADQGLVLHERKIDLNVIVRDRLAATASRYLEHDIEFVGPDEGPLPVLGDPARIEDVLSILLDNAAKYTRERGRVSVTTRRRRDVATIDVTDTGVGIPAEDLPHIFDRFYRSDKAREEGGFGLGLAIAKNIVDSMGGELSVRSTVGEGTTFSLRLPRGRV